MRDEVLKSRKCTGWKGNGDIPTEYLRVTEPWRKCSIVPNSVFTCAYPYPHPHTLRKANYLEIFSWVRSGHKKSANKCHQFCCRNALFDYIFFPFFSYGNKSEKREHFWGTDAKEWYSTLSSWIPSHILWGVWVCEAFLLFPLSLSHTHTFLFVLKRQRMIRTFLMAEIVGS